MNVAELTSRFLTALDGEEPQYAHKAAVAVMNELKDDLDGVAGALDYLTGSGGNALQAFYRAPDLSLLKVSFPAGRRTPPHDHGTWATILVLSGEEKNTLYRQQDDGSRQDDASLHAVSPERLAGGAPRHATPVSGRCGTRGRGAPPRRSPGS